MSLPTVYYLHLSSMTSSLSRELGGKKKRGGHKMCTQIPTGDILVDSAKKEWIIQSSIARGGFGEIYTAASANDPRNNNFVIKIEPSDNGPLFCEKTVYIRIGRKEDIKEYMKLKGLKSIGMPQFYGSGVHSVNGKKFRFLVMDRYGKDLWTIFLEENRKFPPATVFKVAVQVLEVLEYIHSKGYVHADIKGANLLLGRQKGFENQVYLVDFGLAARYTTQYKPDPRRAHNGTIEYTSRDGHKGIVTRRGDIEVLGYNLLQWLSSTLPWEELKDLSQVEEMKNKHMKNYSSLIKSCFKSNEIPLAIEKYFKYLANMEPLEPPNYRILSRYMIEGVKTTGDTGSKMQFNIPKTKISQSPASPLKRKTNNVVAKRGKVEKPKNVCVNKTVEISASSSNTCSDEDIIESTPEKSTKVKRSWKDFPSVVACAQIDNHNLRRSKRKK